MTFKEEVKLYLKSKKITQREFASWVGISGNYAQAILAGRANPSESVKSKMLHLCKLEKVSECEEKHTDVTDASIEELCLRLVALYMHVTT